MQQLAVLASYCHLGPANLFYQLRKLALVSQSYISMVIPGWVWYLATALQTVARTLRKMIFITLFPAPSTRCLLTICWLCVETLTQSSVTTLASPTTLRPMTMVRGYWTFVTNTNLLSQTRVSRNIITDSGLMRTLKSRGIKSTIFCGGKSGLTV